MIAPLPRPWAEIPATGPFLRVRSAAEYLGLSVSHYYSLAKRGDLPGVVKIGERASGVPRPWLDAVVKSRVDGGAK
jgi:excisionase family DNA binding protein